MSLIGAALGAFKWSLLGEIGSRVVGPLVFIVLARVLVPEDFGVVAAATVAISFSQVFWDSGLARALIQQRDEDPALADAAFWINMGLALVLMLVVVAAASSIAPFFGDERIAGALRVLAVQVPLAAACSVMTALMQRRLQFARLFWIRLATTAGPGLASIPLALGGWGYWALVAGAVTGQALQLAVLAAMAGWRPRARIERSCALRLLHFGKWTLLSGALGWCFGWLDAIVVGHFLGARDMGLFRSGNTFVVMVFGLIFAPLMPVLYSLFSRAQHDLPRLRDALLTVARVSAITALPIGWTMYLLREPAASLVFGEAWTGVGAVIGAMALSHAMGWIAGANGELYRAIGRPQVETFTVAVMLAVYVPVYLVVIGYGLAAFLEARVLLTILSLIAHVWVCWRAIDIGPSRWLRAVASPSLASAIAVLTTMSLMATQAVPSSIGPLAALVGLLIYLMLVALLEYRFLHGLLRLLRERAAPAAAGGPVAP